LIFLQVRPFDDEIPPPATASLDDGEFDIDSILGDNNTVSAGLKDKKDKEYKIGRQALDKITYDEIHAYDTYEKAFA
jgi:hypothetical protein